METKKVPGKSIRILVVDDHVIFRTGLARIVRDESGMDVVGEVGDGHLAVEAARHLRPDVILMDISMPGLSGIDSTVEIIKSLPDTKILMLTIYDEDEFLFRSLHAGAAGYLLKGADIDELLRAIRTVESGEIFIYPQMATKLVQEYLLGSNAELDSQEYKRLSPREKELLPLLADGRSDIELADALFISPYTVQTHRQRIMQKLNLHKRDELFKYALKKGLIRLEE